MEKVIYLVWHEDEFDAVQRAHLSHALRDAGARSVRLNFADADVEAAAGLRQKVLDPAPNLLVQAWVDSAIAARRAPVDAVVAGIGARHAAYLVTESMPLRNDRHRPTFGERTHGFAQVALLRRPARLDPAPWLDAWHNGHTPVAIATQSTFEYVQNVVVRTLTPDAPALDAIVEECFPFAAMTDPLAFFAAPGDEARFKDHLQQMMDSVRRFLDLGTIDVVPTSQYVMY